MKKILFLISFTLITCISIAQNSILWEITGKGMTKPSYLFGTIHIQDKRVFSYSDSVELTLKNSDAFAMELILDQINPMEMISGMTLPNKAKTTDFIDKSDSALLFNTYQRLFGSSFNQINHFKPFFASTIFMMAYIPKEEPEAMDMHLLGIARENNKKVLSIEELKDQLNAIDKITPKEQAKMLMQGIKDSTSWSKDYDNMREAYIKGDLDKLFILMQDPAMPENFNKAFLVDRNGKMAKNIASFCLSQPTFCAIGAAHLPGKVGVIALLKKEGFILRPIQVKFK